MQTVSIENMGHGVLGGASDTEMLSRRHPTPSRYVAIADSHPRY